MLRRRDLRLGPLTLLLVTPLTGIDGPQEFTSFSTFGLYSLSASYKRKLDFLLSFLFSSLALTLFLKHSYISFLKIIINKKKQGPGATNTVTRKDPALKYNPMTT